MATVLERFPFSGRFARATENLPEQLLLAKGRRKFLKFGVQSPSKSRLDFLTILDLRFFDHSVTSKYQR